MKKQALVLFSFLIIGGSTLAAMSKVGNSVERVIEFFNSLLGYICIVMLFAHYKGVQFFSSNAIRCFSGVFIFITLADAIYPIYEYSEQNIPSDYWTIFGFQLIFNVFVVKVITSKSSQ